MKTTLLSVSLWAICASAHAQMLIYAGNLVDCVSDKSIKEATVVLDGNRMTSIVRG